MAEPTPVPVQVAPLPVEEVKKPGYTLPKVDSNRVDAALSIEAELRKQRISLPVTKGADPLREKYTQEKWKVVGAHLDNFTTEVNKDTNNRTGGLTSRDPSQFHAFLKNGLHINVESISSGGDPSGGAAGSSAAAATASPSSYNQPVQQPAVSPELVTPARIRMIDGNPTSANEAERLAINLTNGPKNGDLYKKAKEFFGVDVGLMINIPSAPVKPPTTVAEAKEYLAKETELQSLLNKKHPDYLKLKALAEKEDKQAREQAAIAEIGADAYKKLQETDKAKKRAAVTPEKALEFDKKEGQIKGDGVETVQAVLGNYRALWADSQKRKEYDATIIQNYTVQKPTSGGNVTVVHSSKQGEIARQIPTKDENTPAGKFFKAELEGYRKKYNAAGVMVNSLIIEPAGTSADAAAKRKITILGTPTINTNQVKDWLNTAVRDAAAANADLYFIPDRGTPQRIGENNFPFGLITSSKQSFVLKYEPRPTAKK